MAEKGQVVMHAYTVRQAKPEEQRELTRLSIRATMHAGHDEAFIDRTMPALTITVPFINANCVQVAQDGAGEVVGVVWVTLTALPGIALLHGLYVDPARWKRGIGRVLFGAAVARAREITTGAMMIYSEPPSEGFYKRMGAVRIGEVPFYYSPETVLPTSCTSFLARPSATPVARVCVARTGPTRPV